MSYFFRVKKQDEIESVMKAGNHEGAVKAWETRRGGGASEPDHPSTPALVKAYTDANTNSMTGRSLIHYSEAMSPQQAASAIAKAIPDGYNNFNAKKVGSVLNGLDKGVKVIVGREYSPALYLQGPKSALLGVHKTFGNMRKGGPDEIHYAPEGHTLMSPSKEGEDTGAAKQKLKGGSLRLWWD